MIFEQKNFGVKLDTTSVVTAQQIRRISILLSSGKTADMSEAVKTSKLRDYRSALPTTRLHSVEKKGKYKFKYH